MSKIGPKGLREAGYGDVLGPAIQAAGQRRVVCIGDSRNTS